MLPMTTPIPYAMVGGGPGSFIGAVHRMAMALDGHYSLVAGAFSSDPTKTRERAAEWGVPRAYDTWRELLAAEAGRTRLVVIVTPNHLHAPVAIAALEAGFDVACDKPLATSVAEAEAIAAAHERSNQRFLLTHNYTGYPMVREARALVAAAEDGPIGKLRKVYVQYLQGWLSAPLETDAAAPGHKQAAWRTDPTQAGPAGALGDIGTHAHNLVEFISGESLRVTHATTQTHHPTRTLDDDAMALFELTSGATGSLTVSQVCTGLDNALSIQAFGTKGGLEWRQECPSELTVFHRDSAPTTLRASQPGLSPAAAASSRLPTGHPEGYLEAFANLYRDFAEALQSDHSSPLLPSSKTGARGALFVEQMFSLRDCVS
jgi:predicted dehydrogenase